MPRRAPSVWALAWRSLWRDARAGELTVLLLAIALAVAALSAVGFFAERLQAGLQRDARQLLGGDLVLRSDHPLPPEYAQQARALGLALTQHLTFPTMARADAAAGGEVRLVSLKAVQPGYPLRGELRISADVDDVQGQPAAGVPPPGQAWVDAALLEALGLRLGDTLWLGERALQITRVVVVEPDRGAGFLTFAPRVLIHADDLPATGLVQPASRIQYRLVVAGADEAVQRFERWAQQRLQASGERGAGLESLHSGRPELQQTLERAGQFLRLVALLAALLAAVAVAVAARQYALRHLDDCALLRVLGLAQGTMARAYTVALGMAGLAAALVGLVLGWAVHFVFAWWLGDLLQVQLPAPGWMPVALGLGVGLSLMATFGLPPVLQLARVPPLRVMRRDVGAPRPAAWGVVAAGGVGLALLLVLAARDLRLGAMAVAGFALALGLFAAVAWLVLRALRWLLRRGGPAWWTLATRQLAARPAYAMVQVASLAVGLMALLLLVLLRTDLIDSWRAATPADAPNRFVINIQPDQAEAFRAHLAQAGVQRYDWYPMVRGRLVEINGRAVRPQDFTAARAQRLVEREFNLSYSAERPAHNPLAAGRWQPGEAGAVSVETGLAEELGLRLGDELAFDIAGSVHRARITSLRRVDWASMHVNFFVLFPLAAMPAEVPYTYIAAFRVPAPAAGFDRALLARFPNVTSVDTSAALQQVQRVLGQVIGAVEFLFLFSLAAGVVVLLATVGATRAERERDYAVLRALGARAPLLRRLQRTELVGIGALAGLLAALVALAIGAVLAQQVFRFAWQPAWWLPVVGVLGGAGLALLAGWWTLRGVLRTPVVQTLRHALQ
ncbi:MAG: FtsX-like permease family protein [Tepidimonas sp.]|uniref:ABC transporter permease n=1 Tax=Tepidimonas sp. TaxID=2002775 RepID=UPI00298F33D2|nr:FtsX-like permease family protein [Tepidimonas sp.]MDW8335412.1 FtsX-like permease family protein [Tepidimonas sp.]